jgi:hypothetical protein
VLINDSLYKNKNIVDDIDMVELENDFEEFINENIEDVNMNHLNDNTPRYNAQPQASNNQIMEEFETQGFTFLDAIMLLTERYAVEENKNTNAYYYTVLNTFDHIVDTMDSRETELWYERNQRSE